MMKKLWIILITICFCFTALADDADEFPAADLEFESFSQEESFPAENSFEFEEGNSDFSFDESSELTFETGTVEEDDQPSVWSNLLAASRFTLKQEWSYKPIEQKRIVNNRSAVRWEFSRFFWDYFFLQFDTKLNIYWGNDHRAQAEEKDPYTEPNTREAFLQASFGDTSIKAGIQILIWGESDGGAITDVISPRDYSELFFIQLEESRIGQPMVVLDQFTDVGDFSFFYIADPKLNKYAEEGTLYYYDAFSGQAEIQDETSDQAVDEYGLRWKKTFGKSDLAFMAASLIENDYAYQWDGTTVNGKMLITRTRQRFQMIGVTFNYVAGSFLYKGEIGRKSPQSFNNSSYQIVKKDVSDVALGLEYSSGGTYTIGMEAVNSHIHDWEEDLQGTVENTRSLVITWSDSFLNEDFSLNWMSSYSEPFISYFHSLRGSYKWNDHITYELECFYPDIPDDENPYYIYRDEKRVTFKAQVQF